MKKKRGGGGRKCTAIRTRLIKKPFYLPIVVRCCTTLFPRCAYAYFAIEPGNQGLVLDPLHPANCACIFQLGDLLGRDTFYNNVEARQEESFVTIA